MTREESYKLYLGKAMALCSKREYCTEEIREKLRAWGSHEADIPGILSQLTSEKFIDERRYASAFARDKFHYNKWGRIKISFELKKKRIPGEIISGALSSIDEDAYRTQAEKLISDQKKRIKGRNEYEAKAKLLRFIMSKGYESSLVYEIMGDPQSSC